MPELPEVETVARGLQAALPGRRIVEVRLGKTDFIDDPAALEAELPGRWVERVRRYGKFLLVEFAAGGEADGGARTNGKTASLALMIHLGMTGQVTVCAGGAPVAPHTHAFLALDDGREVRYTDIRRFGRICLLDERNREEFLEPFGLDPLEASEAEFRAAISGRRARVKALLLDQSVLRGIGNIYADESLWRARIHPKRIGANLKGAEIARLYRAVQAILKEAIRLRGSSISDYVGADGSRGEFQLRHRVYQRTGKKCARCGGVIRRAIVAGRSSHFCPTCQRTPRGRSR
ncbi:MAG: bifunctional DNA-formamidopyrimidine glycosylase/DNA-(apurinic or apyrimidinic site) lyase [Candidatus Acidiferrales bacterium]